MPRVVTDADAIAATGWAQPPRLAWHHFVAGMSVCGKGIYLGAASTRADAPPDGDSVCRICQRAGYGGSGRPQIDLRGGNATLRARQLVKSPAN